MKKNYAKYLFFLSLHLVLSCGADDSTSPVSIETNPDNVVLSQNTSIEIFIFQNDNYIPNTGELSFSHALKGSLILNSNTTDTSEDSITYTPHPNSTGQDAFQYTICDNSGYCVTENVSITITSSSTVSFDLDNFPYQTLSEYHFYEGDIKNLKPSFGVIPYTLSSPLFSDYAKKKRFIWMPNNTKATYINDDIPLDFPNGAILIKNFYYENVLPELENRIIETRLMIKKNGHWIFANYKWNNAQNEAYLDMNGSFVNLQWQESDEIKNVQYRIPAGAECHTCHKVMEIAKPIGPKPRNLNLEYNYSDGPLNQIDKLINYGYLDHTLVSNNISRLPSYNDLSEDLELRARAYLDINCAHCHSEETHCAYRPMRFEYNATEDLTNSGVCVDPETDLGLGLGKIVIPGDARNSVLHFRLNSIEQSYRMPLLGRTLRHTEGIELIEEWINNLNMDCN